MNQEMQMDKKELLELIAALEANESDDKFKHYWNPSDIKFFGVESRTICFKDEIDKDSATTLISQLMELDKISHDQITLILNTDGGEVAASLAIYDCIRNIQSPVIIYATGICASGGLIILAAGDYRIASENSLFFYHQVVMSYIEVLSTEQIQSMQDLYNLNQLQMDRILKKRTKIKEKDWKQNFQGKTSFYFTAEQALKFNFIDLIDIPEPKKYKFKIKDKAK